MRHNTLQFTDLHSALIAYLDTHDTLIAQPHSGAFNRHDIENMISDTDDELFVSITGVADTHINATVFIKMHANNTPHPEYVLLHYVQDIMQMLWTWDSPYISKRPHITSKVIQDATLADMNVYVWQLEVKFFTLASLFTL